jgi:hypothetical protein
MIPADFTRTKNYFCSESCILQLNFDRIPALVIYRYGYTEQLFFKSLQRITSSLHHFKLHLTARTHGPQVSQTRVTMQLSRNMLVSVTTE